LLEQFFKEWLEQEEGNNMPAVSKSQFRFMAMVASGRKKVKGLTPQKAREWLAGVNYEDLPEKLKGGEKGNGNQRKKRRNRKNAA